MGRCQPPRVVAFPQVELTHKTRPGDYQPPNEIHTMAGMKQTRQLRRIRSLLGSISKLPNPTRVQSEQMHQEWQAICRSRAFGIPFTEWAQHQPEIGPLPRWVPSYQFLHLISQLVKYQVDAKINHDHAIWKKKLRYSRRLDVHDQGAKQAFKVVRGPTKPALTTLRHVVESHVLLAATQQSDIFEAYGEDANLFVTTDSALLNEAPIKVLEVHSDRLMIQIHQPLPDDVDSFHLIQHQHIVNPSEICEHLTSFWHKYWTTDEHNPTTAQPESFQTLLNHTFDAQTMQVEVDNLEFWLQGIKDFKAHSSPGIDGITPAELKQLPLEAVRDAMNILNTYRDGFPEWFMVARTCPIPKVADIPSTAQTRPITVMATLYRWWAKVIGKQVLHQLSKTLPPQVTGLLAHRGPKEAAYNMQAQIEQIYHRAIPALGLTLDLEKCFNTIGREISFKVLCHFGVPLPLVHQWMKSLNAMQRCWHLPQHFGPRIDTNHGVVEGDIWSVVVMVCLAALWTMQIQQISTEATSTAYADNWGMITTALDTFQDMIACTQHFVAITGMKIDWNKSWWWASDSVSADTAEQSLRRCGVMNVPRVGSAKDLGSPMTYKGPCKLGSFRDRLLDAHHRLTRVQSLPQDLTTKTRLIGASVYPAAFYGCKLVPLGQAHLDHLRPKIVSALYGDSSSRNSALAIHLTPSLLDPQVYVIYHTLCAARYFLLTAPVAHQELFCRIVAHHSGNHFDCHGPAGCLKYYIMKFGWRFSTSGQIHLDTFISLDLRQCSKQRLYHFCMIAWNTDLLSNFTERRSWQNLCPIDRRATLQVLTQFGDTERLLLVNELSGAFQTCVQKAKWDPNCPTTCPHCTDEDTREHRLFHCPAFSDIRQPFHQVLSFYQEQGLQIQELAVIFLSPWDVMTRTLQFRQPAPTWMHEITDAFACRLTQGTCQFPTLAATRFASYAIVADLCNNDAERRQSVKFALTDSSRPTLQTLVVDRCQGEHRAELQAIVELCLALPGGYVHTDSQVALTAVQHCQTLPLLQLQSFDNYDLLCRLWPVLQNKPFYFCKVSAHRDYHNTSDKLEAYRQMGNQEANDRAIWACWNLQKEMIQDWITQCRWVEQQQLYLKQLFHLHLELSKTRMRLEQQRKQEDRHFRNFGNNSTLDIFSNWTVTEVWRPQQPRLDFTGETTWGSYIAARFKEWHSKLRWPAQHDGVDEYGVTWYELTVSFMLHLGGYLPLKTKATDGTERLTVCHNYAEAIARGLKLADFCTQFNQLYLQMADLTKPSLMPPMERGLVRSLYLLGAGFQASGFRRRPVFPNQDIVCKLLQQQLEHHRGTHFDFLLELPFHTKLEWTPALCRTFAGSWSSRSLRAQKAMQRLKKLQDDSQSLFFLSPST